MKYLIYTLLLSFALPVFAEKNMAEMELKSNRFKHIYKIRNDKDKYFLSFQENKAKPRTREISPSLAKTFTSRLNEIWWRSEYRKPASQLKCTSYATLSLEGGKPTTICKENRTGTYEAYGMFNKMSRMFE